MAEQLEQLTLEIELARERRRDIVAERLAALDEKKEQKGDNK